MNDYIPHTSEEFDVTFKNGAPVFKDKGGMTGFARRHGGWYNGMFGAVMFMIAIGFLAILAVMFMPSSWSGQVKADILIGICAVGFVGPLIIAAVYIRWKWMKWVLAGLAVLATVLLGAGALLDALVPGLGF